MNIKSIDNLSQANDKVLVEANDWLMKIKAEQMTPETETRFQEWLDENPNHQSKFEMMNGVWERSNVLWEGPFSGIIDMYDEAVLAAKRWIGQLGSTSFKRRVVRDRYIREAIPK